MVLPVLKHLAKYFNYILRQHSHQHTSNTTFHHMYIYIYTCITCIHNCTRHLSSRVKYNYTAAKFAQSLTYLGYGAPVLGMY